MLFSFVAKVSLNCLYSKGTKIVISINTTAVVNGCTSGFMELDLLRRRAEKISGVSSSAGGGLDDEFRLTPGESFSCSGTMTGLFLVGAVRTGRGRDEYPEIQIWRNTGGNTYTRQGSEEITLNPGDFSPDGVLQYNLTTPISYQSGDVLGVYQPDQSDSVVRVYYDSNASNTYRVSESNPTSIPNDVSTASDKLILMSPMSGTYEFKLNIIYAVLYFLSQTHPAALVIFSAVQP